MYAVSKNGYHEDVRDDVSNSKCQKKGGAPPFFVLFLFFSCDIDDVMCKGEWRAPRAGYRSSVSLLHFLHVASKCSGVSDGQVSVIV